MKEYIEREAAIKAIESVPDGNWKSIRYTREIKGIPASDVVSRDCYDRLLVENDELRKERPVVHGYWNDGNGPVLLDKDGCPTHGCYCSVCGDWLVASDEYPVKGNYCPNCGARMDGDSK